MQIKYSSCHSELNPAAINSHMFHQLGSYVSLNISIIEDKLFNSSCVSWFTVV